MAFGTAALAGPYAGLGVALGSNSDVLAQLRELPHLQWVAVTPAHPFDVAGVRRVLWRPPELGDVDAVATVERLQAVGWVEQAESPTEYANAIARSHTRRLLARRGLVTNYWGYGPSGRWRRGWVAMPELYANVQENLGAGAYIAGKYREAGARCVVPWLGGWSDDHNAAEAYAAMRGLFPGVCIYAGEDPIHPAVLEVAKLLP